MNTFTRSPLRSLIATCLMLLAALSASAYDFEADGIYYNITSSADLTVGVTYETTSFNSYSGDVVIPETVINEGTTYTVTGIGGNAFNSCDGLTSVVIPNSVTSIGGYAFGYCSGLTSVTIPNSVTSIGNSAFYVCTGLTSLTIPDSVTSIGNYAFSSCYYLKSVTIGESVETIGNKAFNYCYSLKRVTSLNPTPPTCGTDVFNGVYTSSCYLIVPEGSVDTYASADTWQGFANIFSPDGTPEEFELDGISYKSAGRKSGTCEVVYNSGYSGEVVIPSEVTYDGVTYTVTAIGEQAFEYCWSLTSVVIPNSVTAIGKEAFYDCKGLTSLTIGESVETIGDYAFRGCTSLASAELPGSLTSIGESAFRSCTSLVSVTIPDGVTSIGNGAFQDCTSLVSVTIPDGVTSIGESAFRGCTSLASVTIPDGVISIGDGAFRGCTSLASVELPGSLTSIGDFAFCSCGSLTSVVIPNSVTAIGGQAFDYCYGLTSLTIGESVETIGSWAFSESNKLETVTSLNTTPPTCGTDVFSEVDTDTCVLIVPDGSKDAYASADTWQDFYNVEVLSATAIGSVDTADGNSATVVERCSLDGRRLSAPQKGVNIVRLSDGTVKKVLIK